MTEFSRTSPSPRYRELLALYHRMHEEGDRIHRIPADETFDGRSLKPHVGAIKALVDRFRARTLLDYGAGKAGAYSKATVTLADGRVLRGLKEIWGVERVTLYDPGYPPISRLPEGRFDGVISTDVLEHCPEEDIPWILDEMFGFAERFVFCTVALFPARKSLPTGENVHVTLKSLGWWADRIEAAAGKRPAVRYFAVLITPVQGRNIHLQG